MQGNSTSVSMEVCALRVLPIVQTFNLMHVVVS